MESRSIIRTVAAKTKNRFAGGQFTLLTYNLLPMQLRQFYFQNGESLTYLNVKLNVGLHKILRSGIAVIGIKRINWNVPF